MSATFNVHRFSEYFSFHIHGRLYPAPVIDLDKSSKQGTSFVISKYYLCQLGMVGPVSSLCLCDNSHIGEIQSVSRT